MHTVGTIAPESESAAREAYEALDPAARTIVREVARAMAFTTEEYDERITEEVVQTAHDALFASLLEVHVGTREEFDGWHVEFAGEVVQTGSENTSGVVWHRPGFGDRAVAATFEDQEEAAIATLRRQAFGRLYRELV